MIPPVPPAPSSLVFAVIERWLDGDINSRLEGKVVVRVVVVVVVKK